VGTTDRIDLADRAAILLSRSPAEPLVARAVAAHDDLELALPGTIALQDATDPLPTPIA
jgi:hypothetical protein